MSSAEASIRVAVDPTNPGQFFACCGLLELADRLWPGTEGSFDVGDTCFHLSSTARNTIRLAEIMDRLANAAIDGELSPAEQREMYDLDCRKRALTKCRTKLPELDEKRRLELGKLRREGTITVSNPFHLRLAWWQEDGDEIPKTFAGRQEVLRIVRSMLEEIPNAVAHARPLSYRCFLRAPKDDPQETGSGKAKRSQRERSKVEPFYFDASRFADALDVGFSLDVQEKTLRASAAPLTELLALIGLQRFRPRPAKRDIWSFDYFTWNQSFGVTSAYAVACGAMPAGRSKGYRFRMQFRDDQKRYKAFGSATPL